MNNLYAHIDTLNERIRELEEGMQEIVAELTWDGGPIQNINETEQTILEIATKLLTNQPVSPSADSREAVTPHDRETQKDPILGPTTGEEKRADLIRIQAVRTSQTIAASCDRATGGDGQ